MKQDQDKIRLKKEIIQTLRAEQLRSTLRGFHRRMEELSQGVEVSAGVGEHAGKTKPSRNGYDPKLGLEILADRMSGEMNLEGRKSEDISELLILLDQTRLEITLKITGLISEVLMSLGSVQTDLSTEVLSVVAKVASVEIDITEPKANKELTKQGEQMGAKSDAERDQPTSKDENIQQREEEQNQLETLKTRLAEIGVDQKLIEEIISKILNLDLAESFEKFDKLRTDFGDGIILIGIYKNWEFLLLEGYLDSQTKKAATDLRDQKEKIDRLVVKHALLAKRARDEYNLLQDVVRTLVKVVGIGGSQTILENLDALEKRLPKEDIRVILIKSPSTLISLESMKRILNRYPPKETPDANELIQGVIEYAQGIEETWPPEPFVRSVVEEEINFLSARSNKYIWEYIKRTASELHLILGYENREFVQECIKAGISNSGEIRKKWREKHQGQD